MKKIFLTGLPGCGKSTVIEKVLEELKKKNIKVAGILTPEFRKGRERQGFEIVDIASGKKEIMAAVGIKSPHKVSKYGVDVAAIGEIVAEFEKSLSQAELVVLDEIGRIEFYSEKFRIMLQKILAGKKPLIATLHRAMVKDFEKHGQVIWVTAENREKLVDEILEKIKLI